MSTTWSLILEVSENLLTLWSVIIGLWLAEAGEQTYGLLLAVGGAFVLGGLSALIEPVKDPSAPLIGVGGLVFSGLIYGGFALFGFLYLNSKKIPLWSDIVVGVALGIFMSTLQGSLLTTYTVALSIAFPLILAGIRRSKKQERLSWGLAEGTLWTLVGSLIIWLIEYSGLLPI